MARTHHGSLHLASGAALPQTFNPVIAPIILASGVRHTLTAVFLIEVENGGGPQDLSLSDFTFTLSVPPTPVPTLPWWGLVALAAMFFAAIAPNYRRVRG